MSVLLAVVEAGSLSAASRRLGTPLATVSRKISELESHLRTKLLHRSTRQLTLTDAGRSYLDACRRIIEQVEEAEREAKGEYRAPRGDLTVTAPTVLGHLHLLPVVLEFLVAYPDIDLRLLLSDNILNLLEDRVDLAIRIGTLPDSSMIATRIGAIRRVVCASPTYLAVRGRPEKPSDLCDHDCITFDRLQSRVCGTSLADRLRFDGVKGSRRPALTSPPGRPAETAATICGDWCRRRGLRPVYCRRQPEAAIRWPIRCGWARLWAVRDGTAHRGYGIAHRG
jgi:DNA-binding transcriptional LysR family regulator